MIFFLIPALTSVTSLLSIQPITPNHTRSPPLPYGPNAPIGQYNGTGTPTNVLATYNKTENTKTETNDTSDFSIPTVTGWNNYVNLSFSNITATSEVLLDIETNDTTVDNEIAFADAPFMSFQVSNSCWLHSLESYIRVQTLATAANPEGVLSIYNATNDGGKPKPDQPLVLNTVQFGSTGTQWINYTFGSMLFLNRTNTWNSYFFVNWVNYFIGNPRSHWEWRNDTLSPPDNGYAWWTGSTIEYEGIDLMMNISLRPMGQFPTPSQIQMQTNGTNVNNSVGNSGLWETTFVATGPSTLFDVTATWPITFNYTYFAQFFQTNSTTTNFNVTNGNNANWNITVPISYPNIGADPTSRTLNFTIPDQWTVSGVFNSTGAVTGYQSGTGWVFIGTPDAGNSTWRIEATDQNYLQNIYIYRSGIEISGTEINNTDTIAVDANLQSVFSDGTGRLNIYGALGPSLNEWTQAPVSFWLNFSSFSPSTYTSTNGILNCEVVWTNGWHVGVILESIYLAYTTAAQPDVIPIYYVGDSVPLRVYYNDTYNSAPIIGAVVNVTVDGSTYSMNNQGNGWYQYDWDTTGKNNQDYPVRYVANASGYSQAISTTSVSLYSRTQLDKSWTINTINYNHSIELRVNYTRTTGGSGGIAGAEVNITIASATHALFDHGNGTYSIILNGTDLDLGVHAFTLRAQASRCEPQIDGTGELTVNEEPTTISGDSSKTIETNQEFNITIYYDAQVGGPISGATIEVRRDGVPFAGFTYVELSPGIYNVTFTFDVSSPTTYLLNITASLHGFEADSHFCSVDLFMPTSTTGQPTIITSLIGDNITIGVFYNDTYNLVGIPGATVNITFGGPIYLLYYVSGGYYAREFNTSLLALGRGTHLGFVEAGRNGYAPGTTTITLILTSKTQLDRNWTTQTISYLETITLMLNYSVLTPLGEGGILGATVNASGPIFLTFTEVGSGNYSLEFDGVTLGLGTHIFTITAQKPDYQYQQILIFLTIAEQPTQLTGDGVSSIWGGNAFNITLSYTLDGITPITSAVISCLRNGSSFSSFTTTEIAAGIYNVTFLFWVNQSLAYSLNLTVSRYGYAGQSYIHDISIQVIPTTLTIVSQSPDPILLERTPQQDIEVTLNFTDLAGIGLSGASIITNWTLTPTITPHPTEQGIYNITCPTTGVSPGTCTIVFTVQLTNYEERQRLITFQLKVDIQIEPNFVIPAGVTEEGIIIAHARVTFQNGTPVVNEQVRFTFTLRLSDGYEEVLLSETLRTNSTGWANSLIQLGTFSIQVWLSSIGIPPILDVQIEFLGSDTLAQKGITPQIFGIGMGVMNLFMIYILPILVILLVIVLAIVLAYRKVIKPRKVKQLQEVESTGEMWAQRILGLLDLRALFVQHAKTGLPIFTYSFTGRDLPSELLTGFISAVNSFFAELSGEADRESQLQDIHYQDLHLSLKEGQYITSALILEESPSEEVTESLAEFTANFEQTYEAELSAFEGRIDVFKTADELVGKSFHSELLVPHTCSAKPPRGFSRRIFKLAKNLADTDGRLYLPQLFVAAVEKFGSNRKYAIAHAIVTLRDDGCITPYPP
jgi:hypothetical protein